ncbi:hypothetical protein V8B55DRAFT_1131776 [Mucor lusitanicus]
MLLIPLTVLLMMPSCVSLLVSHIRNLKASAQTDQAVLYVNTTFVHQLCYRLYCEISHEQQLTMIGTMYYKANLV